MIQQTITVNQTMVRDIQRRLNGIENKAPNAITSALNRTISTLSTAVTKEIRKDYEVKSGDVKKTLVKRQAKVTDLSASLSSKGRVLGLDNFKVSPRNVQPKRKKPIKVAVKKTGLKEIKGAFIANANGAKVFKRTSQKRFPIQRLYGPSVPQMFKKDEVRTELGRFANEKFEERLNHEITRLIERNGTT